MGIVGARKSSTVCIREHECAIDDVLDCQTKMFRGGTVRGFLQFHFLFRLLNHGWLDILLESKTWLRIGHCQLVLGRGRFFNVVYIIGMLVLCSVYMIMF